MKRSLRSFRIRKLLKERFIRPPSNIHLHTNSPSNFQLPTPHICRLIWIGHQISVLPVTGKQMAMSTAQKLAGSQSTRSLHRMQALQRHHQLHLVDSHGQLRSRPTMAFTWNQRITSAMLGHMAQLHHHDPPTSTNPQGHRHRQSPSIPSRS